VLKPTIIALLKRNNIPTHRNKSSEEEIQKTAELYRAGNTAKQIMETLQLDNINRVYYNLRKVGVDRDNKYKRDVLFDGRPSVESLLPQIEKDYIENNMHIKAIARKYGYDHACVYRCLQKNGVLDRRPARKTTVYDEYNGCFRRRDPEAMYWFGFFLADGGVVRDTTIALILGEKDREHLKRFAEFIDRPVKEGSNGYGHPNVRTTLYCTEAVEDLKNIGLGTTSPLRFPTDVSWLDDVDFWRGVVDGDGCLAWDKAKQPWASRLNLVGSFEIVSEFKNFLNRNGIYTKASILNKGKIWSFTVGTNKARQAAALLYPSTATVYLQRKYDLAQQFQK
jgi:hypothetical protein